MVERKGVRLDGCMAHRALRWHMHLELRRKKRRVRIPPFGHGISTRRGSYSSIDTHITTQFLDLVVQVTPQCISLSQARLKITGMREGIRCLGTQLLRPCIVRPKLCLKISDACCPCMLRRRLL